MKEIKQINLLAVLLLLTVMFIHSEKETFVMADESVQYFSAINNVYLTCNSNVKVDDSFGVNQSVVDENIYNSMSAVNGDTLIDIFGYHDTPMFQKALECVNPCMAFATTWGEAGSSYPGVSLTTIMDFQPTTYEHEIDWINVTKHLEQVDSAWYVTNATKNVNTNQDGKACFIPTALLQIPRGGDRSTSAMTGLGVGSFQITSSDWNKWDLDTRVNPIYGWEASLKKVGTSWINCGIEPISDITVYAVLSLGHQGGRLITYDFGKEIINIINRQDIQNSINEVARQMYCDLLEKQTTKQCSLRDINVTNYVQMLQGKTGVNFSNYTGGVGSTNKGNYVISHVLRYCFYKYYFTGGM